MKKILFVLALIGMAPLSQAAWFGSQNTNEAAFSSNTATSSTYVKVVGSEVPCVKWGIVEETGTLDIDIVTDGTETSAYPKGNTLLPISKKTVWAGTVYASRLNRICIWAKGRSTNATIIYSSENE